MLSLFALLSYLSIIVSVLLIIYIVKLCYCYLYCVNTSDCKSYCIALPFLLLKNKDVTKASFNCKSLKFIKFMVEKKLTNLSYPVIFYFNCLWCLSFLCSINTAIQILKYKFSQYCYKYVTVENILNGISVSEFTGFACSWPSLPWRKIRKVNTIS